MFSSVKWTQLWLLDIKQGMAVQATQSTCTRNGSYYFNDEVGSMSYMNQKTRKEHIKTY